MCYFLVHPAAMFDNFKLMFEFKTAFFINIVDITIKLSKAITG